MSSGRNWDGDQYSPGTVQVQLRDTQVSSHAIALYG